MSRLLLALLACCAWGSVAAAPACPQPLRIGFYDSPYPPALNGSGTEVADPPGWAVLAVRDAARRLGCTAEVLRRPPRRLDLELQAGKIEFILFYSASAERMQRYRFPLDAAGQADAAWAPMFGHLALYAPQGRDVAKVWDGRKLAPGMKVGVLGGSAQESLARERGWPVEVASSFETSVLALRAGRFALLLSARETLLPEQRSGAEALVELSPVVERRPYFMPASHDLYARHPEFVGAFWREFCTSARRLAPDARGQDCGVRPARP